ncbi:unnamed protein product [Rotaria sp. Silwood1]|nr:unnamed protein product [Rotaria sp. Silwood1]CAF4725160.1 unnamed protein product [Rotaria sp. Silwood1]
MCLNLLILFYYFVFTDGKHFNGGTIRWTPIDPYNNSTAVAITITQSYSWTYPYVKCANNVPISTSTWASANTNLTCVVDCSTDGNYSRAPIDILTDCTSASSSLQMMTSERSKNITLSAGAHFFLAYRGSSWVSLNDPAKAGLEWSIVTYIDLRKRSDGFINTPPVASVVSPQYAIVNRTIQINIPVSDVNTGDDVRCRWSTYTLGYRRRKRSDKEAASDRELIHFRKKRSCAASCTTSCILGCACSCSGCTSTTCTGSTCFLFGGCTIGVNGTTAATTTTETLGTLQSTSSYPIRQAIDECGGICYPGSVPNSTNLSDCTITLTGSKAGVCEHVQSSQYCVTFSVIASSATCATTTTSTTTSSTTSTTSTSTTSATTSSTSTSTASTTTSSTTSATATSTTSTTTSTTSSTSTSTTSTTTSSTTSTTATKSNQNNSFLQYIQTS